MEFAIFLSPGSDRCNSPSSARQTYPQNCHSSRPTAGRPSAFLQRHQGNLHLIGVYTNFYQHKNDHVVVLSCDDFAFTGKTDHEIERFDFFPFAGLPTDVSPGSLRRIREYASGDGPPVVGLW